MTTALPFDVTPYLGLSEGQHFDRKSLFEGHPDRKRPRNRRTVRDEIAEYVAGFANAEGGVLILGLENDGTVTGHAYPDDAVVEMLRAPAARLQPGMPEGIRVSHDGKELLVFDVPNADAPVMVTGNGYPLRIGDQTVKAQEPHVRALKLQGLAESWESRSSAQRPESLDPALIARAKRGAGLSAITDEEYLLRRKLADRRGRDLVLRHAADLLFSKDQPDHPNAGVRLFRVIGTERRLGSEHNVEERPRIEGPLPRVLEEVFAAVGGLLRKPSRLLGTRFRETSEYPEFAWREAILNAVAHRDYAVQGRTTEIFLFDDRMEVASPGGLLADVSLASLRARRRVHQSRNPRLVRVLVDFGYMRDQGEGIPRLYSEMEGLFLPEPELDATEQSFQLTLRNTPTLTTIDRAFIASLGSEDLTDLEFRALLEASRHGRVDNAEMRRITGLDTLGASKLLRALRDRDLLVLHPAGASSYFELPERLRSAKASALAARGAEEGQGSDAGESSPQSGGASGPIGGTSDADGGELSSEQRQLIADLGKKPRSGKLRTVIESLLADRWWTPRDLATALNRDPASLVEDHLGPMVKAGQLERLHADANHPSQAYRAAKNGPLFSATRAEGDE